jgi:hypothetical protein
VSETAKGMTGSFYKEAFKTMDLKWMSPSKVEASTGASNVSRQGPEWTNRSISQKSKRSILSFCHLCVKRSIVRRPSIVAMYEGQGMILKLPAPVSKCGRYKTTLELSAFSHLDSRHGLYTTSKGLRTMYANGIPSCWSWLVVSCRYVSAKFL